MRRADERTNAPPASLEVHVNHRARRAVIVIASSRLVVVLPRRAKGQKRERTIDLASFGDGDKECLVRLVKELAKEGATGDKVRPSPPSAS